MKQSDVKNMLGLLACIVAAQLQASNAALATLLFYITGILWLLAGIFYALKGD